MEISILQNIPSKDSDDAFNYIFKSYSGNVLNYIESDEFTKDQNHGNINRSYLTLIINKLKIEE